MTLTRTQAMDLLHKYGISPRKSLGQNFVIEPNTIRQVIELSSIKPSDFIIEIASKYIHKSGGKKIKRKRKI